ncbi:MAG: sigma-70 family RNA polymerase sigma factor [Antricoccus sp.]
MTISAIEFDDSYLVRRAQDGFLDAFEELVLRHGARVYRTALAMLGDRFEAQDLAQESFLAAWKGIDGFRGQAKFSTWLYQIVTRLCLNQLRRHTPAPIDVRADEPTAESDNPAKQAEQRLRDGAINRAIAQLPPPQRIVVVLHHIEGLPYAEVAKVTRSTVPSVRSNLFRARRVLAHALQDWR